MPFELLGLMHATVRGELVDALLDAPEALVQGLFQLATALVVAGLMQLDDLTNHAFDLLGHALTGPAQLALMFGRRRRRRILDRAGGSNQKDPTHR
jgi:hypothetical protein